MGCSSCGGHAPVVAPVISKETIHEAPKAVVVKRSAPASVVEKSADPSVKVKIRYYGGETKRTATSGCSSCGGSKNPYTKTTAETIMFVSEDSPNNLFKETFSIGRDYYVTEKQAEYLLSLTYQNRGGETVHKFQKVE